MPGSCALKAVIQGFCHLGSSKPVVGSTNREGRQTGVFAARAEMEVLLSGPWPHNGIDGAGGGSAVVAARLSALGTNILVRLFQAQSPPPRSNSVCSNVRLSAASASREGSGQRRQRTRGAV